MDRNCGSLDSGQVRGALRSIYRRLPGGAELTALAPLDVERTIDEGTAIPVRAPTLCSGCPHRSSLWAARTAVNLVGKGAFVVGDIGCYGLGAGPAGYGVIKVQHNMGASVGVALGFASMRALGLGQPVLSVVGDSTFMHAALPALAQAAAMKAPLVVAVLDNSVTAMTGLQPNPATDEVVPIEDIARGMGVETVVVDPLDVKKTIVVLADLLESGEPAVAVLRSPCILIPGVTEGAAYYDVDQDKCIGSDCGCDRFCARVLGCPANLFDVTIDKAYIDTKACTGCSLCAILCPVDAIYPVKPDATKDGITVLQPGGKA